MIKLYLIPLNLDSSTYTIEASWLHVNPYTYLSLFNKRQATIIVVYIFLGISSKNGNCDFSQEVTI